MRPSTLQYHHTTNANNWSYTAVPTSFTFDRGYTLHEHLDAYQLINMNGRVYDPLLGRFLSPDPYVSIPDFTQSFNRYSYGLNNPMMYVDPSGNDPITLISIGAVLLITYLKAAHDCAPEADQGNPANWDWNLSNLSSRDDVYIQFGTNITSGGEATFYGGISNPNTGNSLFVGYNNQNGFGGGNNPSNMYYPNYDYSAPENAAIKGINNGMNNYYQNERAYQKFKSQYWKSRTKCIVEPAILGPITLEPQVGPEAAHTLENKPLIPGMYKTSIENLGYQLRQIDRSLDGHYNGGKAPKVMQKFAEINPLIGITNGGFQIFTGRNIHNEQVTGRYVRGTVDIFFSAGSFVYGPAITIQSNVIEYLTIPKLIDGTYGE